MYTTLKLWGGEIFLIIIYFLKFLKEVYFTKAAFIWSKIL